MDFSLLAKTEGFWLTKIQSELYDSVAKFLEKKDWSQKKFAEHLEYTPSYVSQILNGDFDHKLSRLIKLSLAIGVAPNLKFQPIEEYIEDYESGYDHCINQKNVRATIQVSVNNTPNLINYNKPQTRKTNSILSDNETTIKYSAAGKVAAYTL